MRRREVLEGQEVIRIRVTVDLLEVVEGLLEEVEVEEDLKEGAEVQAWVVVVVVREREVQIGICLEG